MRILTKFSSFCDIFLMQYVIKLDKSTISGYRSAIKVHILPHFGEKRLRSIKRLDVQSWVNSLYYAKGLAPKSVKNIFSVFDVIMTCALKWEYINKNPCELIDLPSLEVKETDYYNMEELFQLILALERLPSSELRFKVAIELAFLCGLRKSEICGLDWDYVDLVNGTLRIMKKRTIVTGSGVVTGKPKTKTSVRICSIPEPLLSHLKQLRHMYLNSNAVISADDGVNPIYPQVLARWFVRFLQANGLRHISLHKLRHTYASLLGYLGVDLKDVQSHMGHAQASTTLNIYTHLLVNAKPDIAEKVTNLLYLNCKNC